MLFVSRFIFNDGQNQVNTRGPQNPWVMWHNILTPWAGQENAFTDGGNVETGIWWIIPGREKHNRKFTVEYGNGHRQLILRKYDIQGDDGHGEKGEEILGECYVLSFTAC